jgi:adenylate cyclase class 2
MQTEIEAKFLNLSHDEIRAKLRALGATCEFSMRQMRRVIFDYPDRSLRQDKHGLLRIRDENDKITVTYKNRPSGQAYANEIETTIGSFETMTALFEAIGLEKVSYQESRRETWHLEDCEVVLDEWPWLPTYIEIEGPSETSIQARASQLNLDWSDAKFGSVDTAYRVEYLSMSAEDSISDVGDVKFDAPVPEWLESRRR